MLPKVFNPPRETKKWQMPRFLKIILFSMVILTGLSYLFFYSSFFKIKNIIIDGPIELAEHSNLENIKGQNILLFKSSNLKKEILEKFPEIADVKIIKGIPDTLKIREESFQSKISWRTQNRLYQVSTQGKILREIEGQSDLPIVQDNKDLPVSLDQQVASQNFIEFITNLNAKFPAKIGFNPLFYEINDTIFQADAVTVYGWKIKFDTTRSVDDQLDALTKFLAEHKDEVKEYADVRVEGKVYYK